MPIFLICSRQNKNCCVVVNLSTGLDSLDIAYCRLRSTSNCIFLVVLVVVVFIVVVVFFWPPPCCRRRRQGMAKSLMKSMSAASRFDRQDIILI